eukprot:TRINITY_DN492_c1_g1_i3.p1 TRINITY_DN492_c1_g1~~TRINITY_DN492_c1_g1_i3.p1  ORF type:complete len:429 (-),score=178.08 TRINITY_DN492_c1_g1_i3:40-1326(-)
MMVLKIFLSLLVLIGLTNALKAPMSCSGQPNELAIGTSLKFMNECSNGKLFIADNVDPPLLVVHVYGTPYEMGFAHGLLLYSQVNDLIPQFYDYIYTMIDPYIAFLPPDIRQIIEEEGVDAALDYVLELAMPYIPQYYFDEIQGLSDASGQSYDDLMRVHMFPELIKAGCSMIGAWGPAIEFTSEGSTLYQLRALDWDTTGPFQKYPLWLVYHPNDGHKFGMLTWSGFIGALTGYSNASMGICEKVWITHRERDNRKGIPFTFLLRDILQWDKDIDDSLSRIASASRTCTIYIGLGQSEKPIQFKALEYSYEQVAVWNDQNFPSYDVHPLMDGVVFLDKHVQPSEDPCLGSLIEQYYGQLDAENIIRNIAPVHKTGDMHIALYDFGHNLVYVSNAGIKPENGSAEEAYKRAYTQLNMTQLFAEPKPSI